MKPKQVLIIYICILLFVCLLIAFTKREMFAVSSVYSMNAAVPDNQLCSSLVTKMFPGYNFSEKAKNVIGTLKPDITTSFGAIGVEPNMNFQCVIPNYPLNPLTFPSDDGGFFIDTSSDLKIFNINVNPRYDGQLRCVGRSTDDNEQIDLPYRDDKTSLRGCTISIASYKGRPKDFEKDLETLYNISREEYEKMVKMKQQERDEALANKAFLDNVNNTTLQQATRWEQIAGDTRNDTKGLREQIDNINRRIGGLMGRM